MGSGRTSLWNWLLARQQGGEFVLRIEDTDVERNREEWTDGIRMAMRWLGLDWDEEYRQSQRTGLYAEAGHRLYASGTAYYCDCARADVDRRNVVAFGAGAESRGYDRHCRGRGLEAGPGRALRFRTPRDGVTIVHDVVRGDTSFQNSELEDFVIARGDGSAMFILANGVDDADMRISHVIRGEEHLSNTPKGILLWEALSPSAPVPVWGHVPVLVNEKRQKLSKRRDKVALEDFRTMGVLPEAMRNYLVLLGWSPGGDRELLMVEEMIELFRLEDVVSSPAFFDVVKLGHMNGEYLRAMPADRFVEVATPYLPIGAATAPEVFPQIAPHVQQRLRLLTDLPAQVEFFYNDPYGWEAAMAACKTPVEMLDGTIAALPDVWTTEAIRGCVEAVGTSLGLKLGKAQGPVRVAITGKSVGPPLFEAMEIIGRTESERRLRLGRARLG